MHRQRDALEEFFYPQRIRSYAEEMGRTTQQGVDRWWRDGSPADRGCAFVPFGAGKRACLARWFALLETANVLASVGQQYHLEPQRDLALEPATTLQSSHDLPVRVHRRPSGG